MATRRQRRTEGFISWPPSHRAEPMAPSPWPRSTARTECVVSLATEPRSPPRPLSWPRRNRAAPVLLVLRPQRTSPVLRAAWPTRDGPYLFGSVATKAVLPSSVAPWPTGERSPDLGGPVATRNGAPLLGGSVANRGAVSRSRWLRGQQGSGLPISVAPWPPETALPSSVAPWPTEDRPPDLGGSVANRRSVSRTLWLRGQQKIGLPDSVAPWPTGDLPPYLVAPWPSTALPSSVAPWPLSKVSRCSYRSPMS